MSVHNHWGVIVTKPADQPTSQGIRTSFQQAVSQNFLAMNVADTMGHFNGPCLDLVKNIDHENPSLKIAVNKSAGVCCGKTVNND
jgi:hypothetical protein